jgi:hypothetical protein
MLRKKPASYIYEHYSTRGLSVTKETGHIIHWYAGSLFFNDVSDGRYVFKLKSFVPVLDM